MGNTTFRDCISAQERLAIFLYRLGHNITHITISHLFGVGESTSRKICGEIGTYLANHMH
jgi:Helix-turn-helix of DDE superfamily endonuclease